MFLYSLMAEGGIPNSLLEQENHYRDVVIGVLKEIEAEGLAAGDPWALQIAARWVARLPQAFQTAEITRLLAELGEVLAVCRTLGVGLCDMG